MAALTDTFTDTNGTDLDAHTSDSTHTYTKQTGTGTLEIQSNELVGVDDNASAFYTASYTPPSADYELEFDLQLGNDVTVNIIIGAGIRCETDSDGAFVRFNGFADAIQLVKVTDAGATGTVLDSVGSLTNNATYNIRLIGSGGNVQWFVDDVDQGTHSLGGDFSAAGLVGFTKFDGLSGVSAVTILGATITETGGGEEPVVVKTLSALGVG